MAELPRGTVTFLFTDIVGSTGLLHELGAERYAAALADHRRVLREAFARQGGVEVDTQGDAFFVAFPTAPGALEAARQAQEALELPVRMGLHTGTPLLTEEGYVGPDVHRAARIAAAGHGRQVLVSASTASLLEASDSLLLDLGEHRLKDLSAPERLYQAGGGEFPRLKTLYQTNLPVPATPFLGREQELTEVRELLERDEVRLLTLAGPGGTGKTRLALQVAAEVSEHYPDGVFWVPLAPLSDPELVLVSAAQTVGAPDSLAEHIADKRLLLLLDNFEHLVEAAAVVADLLGGCPNLHLVVTSRELLRLPVEQVYPVPPLDPQEGIELFTARARAASPSFEPDGSVPKLCERLEQLPLALELAAARVPVLSPAQLVERLSQRLDLLKAGRGADPRQQTLRATIEWSHDLLDDGEQRLFARLAIFRGGCTLTAAEEVCGADLDTLQSLVDKSLVRATRGRFWMLETIREFALERLAESTEAPPLRRRFARWLLALAQEAQPHLVGAEQAEWLQRLEIERDNVRGALEGSLRSGEAELALELATALGRFWWVRGAAEGLTWLERGLEDARVRSEVRAAALEAAGGAAWFAGDHERALRLFEEGLAIYEEVGDRAGMAMMLARLGPPLIEAGRVDEAERLVEEAVSMNRELGQPRELAMALHILAAAAKARGDLAKESALMQESAAIARQIGDSWQLAWNLHNMAESALRQDDPDLAWSLATEALALSRELGDDLAVLICLSRLASAANRRGDARRAGALWGAVERIDHELGATLWRTERSDEEELLGERGAEFELGAEEGRSLSLEEALALVLD